MRRKASTGIGLSWKDVAVGIAAVHKSCKICSGHTAVLTIEPPFGNQVCALALNNLSRHLVAVNFHRDESVKGVYKPTNSEFEGVDWMPQWGKPTIAVLCTTPKGYARTLALIEGVGTPEVTPQSRDSDMNDLLLAVDEEYFCVGEIELDFESSYATYTREYLRCFGVEAPTSLKDFKRAIKEELVSVKLLR